MMRTANLANLRSHLDTLTSEIEALKAEGVLLQHRIKIVKPRGSAGKPSQQKGYARLISCDTGKSKAIAPENVATYQAEIDRGRRLQHLQKQQNQLIDRIDRAAQSAINIQR